VSPQQAESFTDFVLALTYANILQRRSKVCNLNYTIDFIQTLSFLCKSVVIVRIDLFIKKQYNFRIELILETI